MKRFVSIFLTVALLLFTVACSGSGDKKGESQASKSGSSTPDRPTAYEKKTWGDFLNKPPENPVYYPAWNIALPDGSEAQMANKQLTDTALQYLPKAILADPKDFESIWAEYVEAISRINVKAYEDAINEGIQERIKNWSN